MNAALTELSLPTYPYDDYRYFIGDSTTTLALRVLPEEHQNEQTIKKCLQLMTDQYHKRFKQNTKIYPGIEQLLTELEKLNIPKAVLSNKPHEFTKLTVNHFFPDYNFQIVRGVSAALQRKPDPAGALQIAKDLHIPPQQFLYLGDTNTDMITANAAAMFPVGALWGFRQADELLKYGAKKLVKTPADVLKLLTK